MCTQHRLGAKTVEQDQALLVVTDVEVFAQRPWRAVFKNAVIGFNPFTSLALRESLIRRDPRDLVHRPLIAKPQIQQCQRAERRAVVGNRSEDVSRGIWDRAKMHLATWAQRPGAVSRTTVLWLHAVGMRVVAVERARITPIGKARPELRTQTVFPVDVVPTRVDQHAIVVNAGRPFTRFKVAQRDNVATVIVHAIHDVGRGFHVERRTKATDVPAASLRDERNTPTRQETWVEIVPRPCGQLSQFRTIDVSP